MVFQNSSELHIAFYKKAVEISLLSKLISNYLKADLSVLKPNGQEDTDIYFSGDIIRQSDSLAPEIIKVVQEPFSEQKQKHANEHGTKQHNGEVNIPTKATGRPTHHTIN